MSLLTSIQGKIEKRIFDKLGSDVIRTPFLSSSIDKWGDATITTSTTETILAIPYNLIRDRNDYQPFGVLEKGEVIMAFKYDQTLNKDDKITFETKTYILKEIETFPMSGGNVLQLARLYCEL
jgi:hypothetical protein